MIFSRPPATLVQPSHLPALTSLAADLNDVVTQRVLQTQNELRASTGMPDLTVKLMNGPGCIRIPITCTKLKLDKFPAALRKKIEKRGIASALHL